MITVLIEDNVVEISKHLTKKQLFAFLSTCRFTYSFIGIFYRRYSINLIDVRKKFFKKRNRISGNKEENLTISTRMLRNCRKLEGVSSIDILNPNLTDISFGFFFNDPVDNLPDRLSSVDFQGIFDRSIDNLPDSIVSITFQKGCFFNQPIKKLPRSLKILKLGRFFNQPLSDLYEKLKDCPNFRELNKVSIRK